MLVRPLAVLFFSFCCLLNVSVAQEGAVAPGEIGFHGTVLSFDEEKNVLVMSVASFTLPNGKSSKLAAPKPKTVTLSAETQLLGAKGVPAKPLLKAGAVVTVIGQDAGSGKDVPARLVVVEASPAASTLITSEDTPKTQGTDPNAVALQAGETRFEGKITGILSATNFTVEVFAVSTTGDAKELLPSQSKTVLLDEATLLRSRGDARRKLTINDLKIGQRVTFSGKDTGARIKAREAAVWEIDTSASESIGTVTISAPVSRLLHQADQASDARVYEEALRYLNQALQIASGGNDRPGRGLTLNRLANIYSEMGQLQKAVAAYEEALAIWRGLSNSESESLTLNNYALLLGENDQEVKAITMLERAVQLARGATDTRALALPLQNLTGLYFSTEKYDKALATALEALPILRQIKRGSEDEAMLSARIARIYALTGKPDKSKEYSAAAAPLLEQIREADSQAYGFYQLGSAYELSRDKGKAVEFFKRAQALYTQLNKTENAESIGKIIADIENPPAAEE